MDELLCQSLLLFRQYRFYDAPECGEKAFRILEEAHVWMGRTQECVDMAKWGCVIECLAQKYYIEDDTDAILEDHINHCLVDAIETGDDQVLKDLNEAINKFVK